jgi:retron-type reverse transcriptase
MKRYGQLWEQLIAWPNLLRAARKAQRGKRDRHAVQHFNFTLEVQLLRLSSELIDGRYRPGAFRSHWITRPKPRLISAAPYRDRVVHHALMNVLEPILDRHFHPDSYACRKGKGTHAAAIRVQQLMGRCKYFVHCDIRKFFPSIDHAIMKEKFRGLIKDPKMLRLMDLIVDCSNRQELTTAWFDGDDLFTPTDRRRGLPIGNLTSQWFANWMLNDLDHRLTSHLRIGGLVRYCDDFILLDNDRGKLADAVSVAGAALAQDRLELHEQRLQIRDSASGCRFVGYRIWPTHRMVRKKNVQALRRRVRWMRRAYAAGQIDMSHVRRRLRSWIGHASQANSRRLIRSVSRQWVFSRNVSRVCKGRGQTPRVFCAVARGTTTPTIVVPRTATTTRPTIGTTTSGSVSSCTLAAQP